MHFRFFALNDEGGWDLISELGTSGPFADVRGEVERHFEELATTLKWRQLILLCTSLGDPPGRIVAAEAVYVAHLSGKVKPAQQSRSLVWLVEDYVPKH